MKKQPGADAMTAKPVRVQLSRKRGWKLPANTVRLDRATAWGNPYRIVPKRIPYTDGTTGRQWDIVNEAERLHLICLTEAEARQDAVSLYREWAIRTGLAARMREVLAGKNVACWCGPEEVCHGDVVLELANP